MLERVYISEGVVQGCLAHAFTTEQEEVMGVLLGEIYCPSQPSPYFQSPSQFQSHVSSATAGRKRARVSGAAVVQRSVQRADRVEIPAAKLAGAAAEAERLGTRVVGWYHSHPRITPYPSHVDLRSQRSYQQLESGWVGLIFSVFYTDASHKGGVSIHCFQTGPDDGHVMVEFEIVPRTAALLSSLPSRDVTHQMLRVFAAELEEAVERVIRRSGGAADATSAARALRDVQLYTLEKLIARPALRHIHASITQLEERVKYLREQLQIARR